MSSEKLVSSEARNKNILLQSVFYVSQSALFIDFEDDSQIANYELVASAAIFERREAGGAPVILTYVSTSREAAFLFGTKPVKFFFA